MDELPEIPVRLDIDAQDLPVPISAGMAQHDGSCSVTEKDAGGPILIVDSIGYDLPSHHKGIMA
jgi:hypothetical protein